MILTGFIGPLPLALLYVRARIKTAWLLKDPLLTKGTVVEVAQRFIRSKAGGFYNTRYRMALLDEQGIAYRADCRLNDHSSKLAAKEGGVLDVLVPRRARRKTAVVRIVEKGWQSARLKKAG